MNELFDAADFYSCDERAERFVWETPEEAIAEEASENGDAPRSVTVYAFTRRTLNDGDLVRLAERLVHSFEEWAQDEGVSDPDDSVDITPEITAAIEAVVQATKKTQRVWECPKSAKREFAIPSRDPIGDAEASR